MSTSRVSLRRQPCAGRLRGSHPADGRRWGTELHLHPDSKIAALSITALVLTAITVSFASFASGALADTGLPAPVGEAPATLPFSFLQANFQAIDVTAAWRPFTWDTARALPVDVNSIAMKRINGVLYNHPVDQANCGLSSLNAFRLTANDVYLAHAKAQADHLIGYHVGSSGAWFYPYRFRWDDLNPPWYSAMAQGMVLALFARLYEVTGDATYKNAADRTFQSFLVAPNTNGPWIVEVDGQRYLRLEEYPKSAYEFVFNGHIFAAFGLCDYYRVTGDARALALYRGALTAGAHYAPLIRNPGWISAYSLGVRSTYAHYHAVHIAELLELYTVSGWQGFAEFADQFSQDYPSPKLNGTIHVAAGRLTGYRFAANGTITGTRLLNLGRAATMEVTRRARVRGRAGYWFSVTTGSLAGYCLVEVAGRIYYPGLVARLTYRPARRMRIRAGLITGATYDAHGRVTGQRTVRLTTPDVATISERATIDGYPLVHIATGRLAGYWIAGSALTSPAALGTDTP